MSGTAATVAAAVTAILVSGDTRPAQQLQVAIIGNMGGTVTVDGDEVIRLDAYDGADQTTVTASERVHITVTSSGSAPRCSVHTMAGAVLVDRAGHIFGGRVHDFLKIELADPSIRFARR